MYLEHPTPSAETEALFRSDQDGAGFVMNLTRLWAWRPDVLEAFAGMRSRLLQASTLSPREQAVIVCAAVASLGDSYCSLAWGEKLASRADADLAAAVLRGDFGKLPQPRERALAEWAWRVASDPNATTSSDVERLRAAGLSEREIFEATALVAFRAAFSTINSALGAQPDWQVALAAPAPVRAAVTYGRTPQTAG
jgi:uncharacterized peroxidase-related enzyme